MLRKKYVDYVKAIGIILVIAGHVNFANQPLKLWIYSFHMPLFFFATGLVFYPQEMSLRYLEKKIQSFVGSIFCMGINLFRVHV